MKTIIINASEAYPIYLGAGLLTGALLKDCCEALNKRVAIITDDNLVHTLAKEIQTQLQRQHITAQLFSFPAGEQHKTREIKQAIEDTLLAHHYGRDTCLIAVGGGVVTDLIGFIAATYCRGVPVIYVPTTLLAMVDASIGGKTGVNTPLGKNLIGSFKQPHAVVMDIHTLNTLPDEEWCNGMAEIIKHALIQDADLFTLLQNNTQNRNADFLIDLIYRSCAIKKNIIEQDEQEHDIRQLLNFGHTVGHAIEHLEKYAISHGEAVAIGILVESYLSMLCGYLDAAALPVIKKLLQSYGLPLRTTAFQDIALFKQVLLLDKKTVNQLPRFVLLDVIGEPHIISEHYTHTVTNELLDKALQWAQRFDVRSTAQGEGCF
jgi:3-dehydroquinate synthase